MINDQMKNMDTDSAEQQDLIFWILIHIFEKLK
jgi:hypothetical protein